MNSHEPASESAEELALRIFHIVSVGASHDARKALTMKEAIAKAGAVLAAHDAKVKREAADRGVSWLESRDEGNWGETDKLRAAILGEGKA